MPLYDFNDTKPAIDSSCFIAKSADIIGQVTLGADTSVWFNTVIRGDVNTITIGCRTNVQDGTVIHVTHAHDRIPDGLDTVIGNDVTIGHKAIIHGCHIHDQVLIGMGAIICDGAVIESNVLVGAGALVAPGKVLEEGWLYVGNPARAVRRLSEQEVAAICYSADHYANLKQQYITQP